jgi:superfamily II DNA or RNA helicase
VAALGASERRDTETAMHVAEGKERLILATGRYLGEGFDDPRLDTLFLTMPISWRGTLTQYVGRLHRDYQSKKEVIVYDYVDVAVPVLVRMAAKRQAGYKALGYVVK